MDYKQLSNSGENNDNLDYLKLQLEQMEKYEDGYKLQSQRKFDKAFGNKSEDHTLTTKRVVEMFKDTDEPRPIQTSCNRSRE